MREAVQTAGCGSLNMFVPGGYHVQLEYRRIRMFIERLGLTGKLQITWGQLVLVAAATMMCILVAPARSQIAAPTDQQMEVFKTLPKDQQDAILQGALGKSGSGVTKPKDSRTSNPQTVQPPLNQQRDASGRLIDEKTRDGHQLRIPGEDPELRPNDSVLVELSLKSEGRKRVERSYDVRVPDANATDVLPQLQNKTPEKKLTDEEQKKRDEVRQRIQKGNPYRLNRFGVIEIPGLQAIPLAGLTADEATERLSADPELSDFDVKVSLLRLRAFGDDALKPFGYDLFEGVPSTFAPVTDIPVPGEYVVGPGDTLEVQLYGNNQATYSLPVSRDGNVSFPKIGPIQVGGMSFSSAQARIDSRVRRELIGTHVKVAMGDLRTIRVFVLGEAERPGSYIVSGLSTMTNALFVSGGVKKIGSLRRVQLKRDGRLVSELDLYQLLLHGDTSGDRRLMPGDVIFIPPVGATVSVNGEVRRPAIYEILKERFVGDVLKLAGGLTPEADSTFVHLERITPGRQRVIRDVDLAGTDGTGMQIADGDKIHVQTIRPTLEDSVTLSGHVFRPGKWQYRPGLRLSDVLGSLDELRSNADRHYIMIRRQLPPDEKLQVVSADLDKALASRSSADDIPLKPRDQIYVFDLTNNRERVVEPLLKELEVQATLDTPAQIVSVGGRVKAPGRYALEPGMRVSDLIRAGGSLEDAAYGGDAELTRYDVKSGGSRQTELLKIDLAAIRRGDTAANFTLRPYDFLIIKETPEWEDQSRIELTGEVRFPGKYPVQRGETLRSVLMRAGGLTDLSFSEGAVFTRETLKKREKEQIESLSDRFQSDLTSLSLEALSNTNGSANAAQALAVGQSLIDQLRNSKPVGRLVINIDQVLSGPPGGQGDVLLKDGDKLFVPKKTQEVTVLGEVQSPTSHVVVPGLSRDDYIAKSGGLTQRADRKRIYVVRANGSVLSNERRGWFRRGTTRDMEPGDTIVVPMDAERIRPLPLWTAVTTIIYNLAVAVAAISRF